MNLKQLKLAGFKSFVDPTVVHFPSQLVAVLGPNGCGKSNIIDAVRWVMGESSAKNLRGESMVDVIFNGSSNRKPLGQASVELVFDNSLGRLTGPFASYGEIAVKRVVTRDGDSAYFLNGSRCRRRDITDIFLGTGAGSKGYSIIGQGTISRLIEAKPEELRAFLEEAAGVSKYKERRRETLQRIEHTRDNLTRVADIRDELDKQLQRLERQAKSAERYTVLKEEEQLCRAQIMALKWQDYHSQQAGKQQELQQLAIKHEQQQSVLTGSIKQRTELNEQMHEANEHTQLVQSSFYQLGTEIARLEETIQQQDREKKRLESDRQQLQNDSLQASEQLKQDKEELQFAQDSIKTLQAQVGQLKQEYAEQQLQCQQAQIKQNEWEQRWQQDQNTANQVKNQLQISRVKLEHLEEKHRDTVLRIEKLQQENTDHALSELQLTKTDLAQKQIKLQETQAFDEQQLKDNNETVNSLRAQLKETELQLHQLQDEFHRLNSEHAALLAAQRAARKTNRANKEELTAWSGRQKLMDVLQVQAQWQAACEIVLGDSLHAYVLDSFEEFWPHAQWCQTQGESVVTLSPLAEKKNQLPRLADKIQGAIPANLNSLNTIYAADSLEQALSWLPQLAEHESVITIDGFWFGQGWVKLTSPAEQDDIGLLARQQKIAELTQLVELKQHQIDEVRVKRDDLHTQLQNNLNYTELFQLNLNASNEALRVNANAASNNQMAIEQAEKKLAGLELEKEELKILLEDTAVEQLELVTQVQELELQNKTQEQKQLDLTLEKQNIQLKVSEQQHQLNELRESLHQAEKEWDKESTKSQQLSGRISREQERLDILEERLEHIALLHMQSNEPGTALQSQLAELLARHGEIEEQLTSSREKTSQLRLQLEELEKLAINYDFEVKKIQDLIGQIRLEEQALAVRASGVEESLAELNLNANLLLENIPLGVTQSACEDELIALTEKIKRLGPINLAAIDEFAAERQRKEYLDEQYEDLSKALLTLETAINKMDDETRLRLENTFDEVNTSFKALFPRLFGGGRAQLELTCDNLLEAGIVVMAQPPGKRNSTIHLLSGGEKAMTAVALVFAIFQLNPSPFCMLDEVDAPLDDVNVGRFCALVKEMSQFVQFLFITHNKVTMELADHLIGVTMREPGVSRLVTVDVKQALTME